MAVSRFQQMDVYVAAIEYVGQTRPLVVRLRRTDLALADQMHRAVVSIPLNIAEGAGEYSPADKGALLSVRAAFRDGDARDPGRMPETPADETGGGDRV